MFQQTIVGPMLRSLVTRDRATAGAGALVWILALLAIYLIIAPVWSPRLLWWRYDNARLLEICLLVLVCAAIAVPAVSRAVLDSWCALGRAAQALLAVFGAVGAVSAALSPAPQLGTLQLSLTVLLIATALSVAAVVRRTTARAEQVLSVAICAGGLLVVLQFWASQAVHMLQDDSFPWVSPFLTFANVRFFSQYQAYALLLMVLPITLFRLGCVAKILLYLLAANFWSLQWMVGTRAVWLGFLVAAVSVALFARADRARWFRQQSVGLIGGFIIFVLFTQVLMPSAEAPAIPKQHSVTERGWQSVNARLSIIQGGLRMIREEPLLGVGPGQFGHNYSVTLAAHPHNSALQFLAEYGLVSGGAAVLLLAMLGMHALRTLRARTPGQSGITRMYLAAALIMGLVDSRFSGNLTMPHSQIMFAVAAGWLLARGRTAAPTTAPLSSSARRRELQVALSALVLLAAVVTAILTFEYINAVYAMPWWLEPNPPNLWQYGRFSAW